MQAVESQPRPGKCTGTLDLQPIRMAISSVGRGAPPGHGAVVMAAQQYGVHGLQRLHILEHQGRRQQRELILSTELPSAMPPLPLASAWRSAVSFQCAHEALALGSGSAHFIFTGDHSQPSPSGSSSKQGLLFPKVAG